MNIYIHRRRGSSTRITGPHVDNLLSKNLSASCNYRAPQHSFVESKARTKPMKVLSMAQQSQSRPQIHGRQAPLPNPVEPTKCEHLGRMLSRQILARSLKPIGKRAQGTSQPLSKSGA